MTTHTYYVADLADMGSVIFECQNQECKAKIFFNPDKEIKLLDGCPQCGTQWADPTTFDRSAIIKFLESLRVVRGLQQGNRVRIKIELPVKSEDKK